ncbi:MAG: HesA/MoeB/ThiF family protein [Candidatus Brocadiia bacterium]
MEKFSRHIRLPGFGVEGQEKLSQAKILIIGAGGLGSPAATYLAAAGIGTLGIVDYDDVDISNLPRQILHTPATVDQPKITSAQKRISELNPDVKFNGYHENFKAGNALKIMKNYDLVIDGTDNFPVKFLINDACVIAGLPLVHAGVLRYGGQVITIIPKEKTACYRCIFRDPPPVNTVSTCSEAGILNTVAGVIGLIQATEAIKYIVGVGGLLTNRLFIFDALGMQCRTVQVKHNDDCPVCGLQPTIKALQDMKQSECR